MVLGLKGTELIKSFESLKLESYQDQRGIWTIGWGHTLFVQPYQTCTSADADLWFAQDTNWVSSAINNSVKVPLNQNQFDALASFTFNVGVGSEAHSTLVKDLNVWNIPAAANQFLVWNHVNGVVDPGLTRRRQAEQTLFLEAP